MSETIRTQLQHALKDTHTHFELLDALKVIIESVSSDERERMGVVLESDLPDAVDFMGEDA